MANINLVTGKLGTPHVSSADDGSLNAAIFGEGAYLLNRGQKLRAEVINSNTVRIYDGDFCMQGRQARVDSNTYVDMTIENGSQGMKRNDLICVRYEKDIDTLNETAQLVVIKGTESAGTAVDPTVTEGDIFNGDAVAEFPLWRIPLNGITVGAPKLVCDVSPTAASAPSLDRGNAINNGDDLNDYSGIGTYYSASASVSASLVNCPYSTANFKLLVFHCGTTSFITQMIITGASNPRIFMRAYASGSWTAWLKFEGVEVSA